MRTAFDDWQGCAAPAPDRLTGRLVHLSALSLPDDPPLLWEAFGRADFNDLAFYFPCPIMRDAKDLGAWLGAHHGKDWHTMVFRRTEDGAIVGMASYMRIDAANGSCETGSVMHAASAQRGPAVTEAHYLMARHVFDDLGYRRYEWKLDDANEKSHAAARRLGFTHEGVFRQHMVVKGRNRDTAWYSMTDSDWPSVRAAMEAWLDPSNFDAEGGQRQRLADIRQEAL